MFDFKNKKSIACLIIMLISLAVMLITFYATDSLLGDKEFSYIDSETEFFAFDRNEFKRACCRTDDDALLKQTLYIFILRRIQYAHFFDKTR